jgi:hypothetical protein
MIWHSNLSNMQQHREHLSHIWWASSACPQTLLLNAFEQDKSLSTSVEISGTKVTECSTCLYPSNFCVPLKFGLSLFLLICLKFGFVPSKKKKGVWHFVCVNVCAHISLFVIKCD